VALTQAARPWLTRDDVHRSRRDDHHIGRAVDLDGASDRSPDRDDRRARRRSRGAGSRPLCRSRRHHGAAGLRLRWRHHELALDRARSRHHARVCSYDRPGTGTSDPASSNATFTTQAHELHTLLDTIGEPGPYVAVGHSFGGAEAITFASLFADEVTGLVLVDASPTTWPAALCAVVEDGSEGAAMLRGLCTSAFPPTGNGEQLDVIAAFAEASRIASLGSLPMAVITATHREVPADLAAPEVERLNDAWDQGQQAWMALSSNSRLVPVDDTGHNVQIDQPGVVIDEISRLLP
jgi:pimeloyl-ACP methyl ester carboxylesterase